MTKGLEPSINTAKAGNRKTLDLNKLITQGNRLLAAGKDTQAKDLIERALKQHGFEDATLHFQCGLANMNLGYLLYAQNMFERAIAFNASSIEGPNSQIDLLAYTQLGYTFKLQEQSDQAIESFLRALELKGTPDVANEIGKLYLKKGDFNLALEYCSYAIEMATEDILNISPERLADLYCDRVQIYEQLHMLEHARSDQRKILEADPNFI